jgi:hypothetical protein
MSHSDKVERECMDRFIRAENVARFRHSLAVETVGAKHKMLSKLLEEEFQKQREAGDATNEAISFPILRRRLSPRSSNS